MTNVFNLGGKAANEIVPNESLISAIKDILAMAESGQLQSYIGTGFTSDGLRLTTWCDYHDDLCQMLGALMWLQDKYIRLNHK